MKKETCSNCSNVELQLGVDEWLKNGNYLSHDIVNELIAHNLLRNLLAEIHQSPWFSLIADETRDESGLEQLSISIRLVDESYSVYEDIVGMSSKQMLCIKSTKRCSTSLFSST